MMLQLRSSAFCFLELIESASRAMRTTPSSRGQSIRSELSGALPPRRHGWAPNYCIVHSDLLEAVEEIFHKSVVGQLDDVQWTCAAQHSAHKLPFSPSLKELFKYCKHCKNVFQVGWGRYILHSSHYSWAADDSSSRTASSICRVTAVEKPCPSPETLSCPYWLI